MEVQVIMAGTVALGAMEVVINTTLFFCARNIDTACKR